ncbi:MAG: M48 family metalloprotease [Pseudobdellovibrionaceae bacterium]
MKTTKSELDAQIKLKQVLQEWTATSFGRRQFLAYSSLLLASCATTEKTRTREGDNTGQETAMTVNDEKKMTQEVLPEMRKQYPPLNNPYLQNYVVGLGRKITAANGLEGNPYNYSFAVVDVNYVNAFALPAGTVFVTTPLIAMAESEAELAGVIGHEIGHVTARHTAERIEAQKKAEGKTWLLGAGGGILGGVLGYGAGKLLCAKGDNECMTKATVYGAAAGVGGGLLIQKFKFMANSREDEMEADRIGFKTSVRAGYDRDSVGKFYAKLLQMEKQSKQNQNAMVASLADAMSTHPPSQERVNQMNQMAQQQPQRPNAIVNTKEFEQAKKISQQIAQSKPKTS